MEQDSRQWRLGRRPELDGLRALAVTLVVLKHANVPYLGDGGVVGVTMFFVLSGFLITALLIEERGTTGRIALRQFYMRRALRLLPALWFWTAVVTLFAIATGLFGGWFISGSQPLRAVAYLTDLTESPSSLGALTHTWSLAVEEKFYLLWPLVLVLASSRRVLAGIAMAGIVACTVARVGMWLSGAPDGLVQYGPQSHAASLLVGCLLAIVLVGAPARSARPWAGLALAGCAALLSTSGDRMVWIPAGASLLTGLALWLMCRGEVVGGPLAWEPLVWLGRRSYGLYLIHWPVSWLFHGLYGQLQNPVAHLILVVPVSLLLTALSYRYVEEPFLRMKHQRSARAGESSRSGHGVEAAGRLPGGHLGGQPVG